MIVRKNGMISLLFAFLLVFNFNIGYAENVLMMDEIGGSVPLINASGDGVSDSSAEEGTMPVETNESDMTENDVDGTSESAVDATTKEILLNNDGLELVESYSFIAPEGVDLEHIEYNQYNIGYFYVVAVNSAVNIRKKPDTGSPVIKKLGFYGKMNVFEKVKGQYFKKSDSDEWYRV